MTDPGPRRLPSLALWSAMAVTLILIGAGAVHHWNVTLPLVGFVRFLRWVVSGIYCAVPVIVLGAATTSLVRRPSPDLDGITRLSINWCAGWAVVVVVGIATLATGCYSPLIWQLTAMLLWVAAIIWLAATRWALIRQLTGAVQGAVREPIRLFSWTTLLLGIAIATALHASLPPDTRDELSYHLVMPQLWAVEGNWWIPLDNFHLAFPANTEITWAWAWAVSGPVAPRFVTFAFAVLTLLLMAGWLAERGTAPWIRDLCLVFFAVTPVAMTAASICYVEWPLLFFLLLGWRLAGRSVGEAAATSIIWTAVSWGMAAGIKYTAAPFVALLGLQWVWRLARRRRAAAATAAAFALVAAVAVLSGPWLVRNWHATGDPVFPLGATFGLGGESPHEPDALSYYADLDGSWRWMPWLYHATVDPVGDHRLHPLWPILHVVVLAVGWRWRRELPWFTVAAATVALAAFTPAPRIYLPLMLLVWLFLPSLIERLPDSTADRRLAATAVGLMAMVSLPITLHFMFAPGGRAVPDYLLGVSGRQSYLADRGLVDPVTSWVSQNTSPEARIWAWCEDRTLYFDRWARSDSPYGPPAFLTAIGDGTIEELDRQMEASGLGYVILRRDRCPESFTRAAFEKRSWDITPDQGALLSAWADSRLQELLRGDRYILYRVR